MKYYDSNCFHSESGIPEGKISLFYACFIIPGLSKVCIIVLSNIEPKRDKVPGYSGIAGSG